MKPLSKDLREFIQLLNSNSVEYVIVGAWALAYHGRPRYTGDLDIFVRSTVANAGRVMAVLKSFGFGNVGIAHDDFLKPNYVVQLGYEPNRIDLLTGISDVTFDEAWDLREYGKIDSIEVPFLSRALLIRNKKAAGRGKDLGDIETLERTKRS